MKHFQLLIFGCLMIFAGINTKAQNQKELPPDAILEIRYWQDVSQVGQSPVLLDTMIYQGDRASFSYTNAECVSFHCRSTDSLVYSLLPNLYNAEKEWTLGQSFIRKLDQKQVNFQGDKLISKIYVSDVNNKNTGIGDYSIVTKKYGVVTRWNLDGEVYQLIRIDRVERGQTTETDLIPLLNEINTSGIFGN